MPVVKSDPCFRLKGVSNLYPVRPGLDKMTADWKRPRTSSSYFSVDDRIFIRASDRSRRETVRVVLWLTIVQPEGFAHFAPTYDFPIKQPNLAERGFIHGASLTEVRAVAVYHAHKMKNSRSSITGLFGFAGRSAAALLSSPNFQRDFIHGGNSAGKAS